MSTPFENTEIGVNLSDRIRALLFVRIDGLVTPNGPVESYRKFQGTAVWSQADIIGGGAAFYVRLSNGEIWVTFDDGNNDEVKTNIEIARLVLENLETHYEQLDCDLALDAHTMVFDEGHEGHLKNWKVSQKDIVAREKDPNWRPK